MSALTDHAGSKQDGPENRGRDKQYEIAVNGEEKTVTEKELSFSQITALAFPESQGDANASYTVTYRKSDDQKKPAGTLVDGETVKVKDGTTFDVTRTIKS